MESYILAYNACTNAALTYSADRRASVLATAAGGRHASTCFKPTDVGIVERIDSVLASSPGAKCVF